MQGLKQRIPSDAPQSSQMRQGPVSPMEELLPALLRKLVFHALSTCSERCQASLALRDLLFLIVDTSQRP